MRARRSATDGNFGTRKSFASRNPKLTKEARISFVANSERFLGRPYSKAMARKNCPLPPPSNVLKAGGRISHDKQIARNHHLTVSHWRAGSADRREPVRRGSVDRRRGQPAARAHGPGKRDRARAQRLPALR